MFPNYYLYFLAHQPFVSHLLGVFDIYSHFKCLSMVAFWIIFILGALVLFAQRDKIQEIKKELQQKKIYHLFLFFNRVIHYNIQNIYYNYMILQLQSDQILFLLIIIAFNLLHLHFIKILLVKQQNNMARNNRILKEINTFKLWQLSDIKIGLIDQKDIKNYGLVQKGHKRHLIKMGYLIQVFNIHMNTPLKPQKQCSRLQFIILTLINQEKFLLISSLRIGTQLFLFQQVFECLNLVLLSIQSILDSPFLDNPIEPEIAWIYQNDRSLYNKTVRMWVKKYAQ